MSIVNKTIIIFLTICYILFCGLKNNTLQVFLDNIIVQKKVFVNADEPILVSDNVLDLFESINDNCSDSNLEQSLIEFERKEKFEFNSLKHFGAFEQHKTPPPETLCYSC